MPQKVIKFKGINRDVNEFQTSGECEELINLRPKIGGGHRVVRPKRVIRTGVPYIRLYEHTFGDVCNQIAVNADGSVDWIREDGGVANITRAFTSSELSISSAGNVLLMYCSEDDVQLAFRFKDNKYESFSVSLKPITNVEVSYEFRSETSTFYGAKIEDESTDGYNSALDNAVSAFQTNNPNGLCGVAVIGCTYELEDGAEVWSTAFVVANVTRCKGYKVPLRVNDTAVVVGATRVSLNLKLSDAPANGVKRINVYASRPMLPYEAERLSGGDFTVKELSLDKDLRLDNQLMYYQGSVAIDRTSASLVLNFGKTQAGEKVMPVTSGCIERTGNAIAYNNRFHFFKSNVNHVVQVPTISATYTTTEGKPSFWIAYVEFERTWRLIDKRYQFSEDSPNDFVYPMAGVKRLAFVKAFMDDYGNFDVPYSDMFYVNLRDSASYNYSYAFGITPSVNQVGDFEDLMTDISQTWGDPILRDVWLRSEVNAINVSAQYNPFVFPVEYSYSFSGEIRDIATSYLPISSTQVGQYPLTVFTSSGVFSMEQGNVEVLYSNIVPLQPLVIDGKSTATPFGTFFISSRNLFLLSGRDIANVSFILNGEMEINLRNLDSYRKLVCNTSGVFYNYEPMLSGEDFEDFIEDAHLTYDQLQNELYISSSKPEIPYSYVFNLDTKSYHKVIKKYLNSQSGSRYVIETIGDDKKMVDLFIEDKSVEPIFLQSRPMPLEAVYTHIQRLILLADATLKDEQYLCISVFGSDNLYDWKCITSSQKQNVVFRQIRTNRAAKSNKDYVVVITGDVDTNTDISDIIADYTVVNRRLG
jgi:hypothetical protein